MSEAEEALAKAEELLERLRMRVHELPRLATAENPDAAVDGLAEVADLAKQAQLKLELAKALAEADAQP